MIRPLTKERMITGMIDFYKGNSEDISHFLKVYALASAIGKLEGLDPSTQQILELAAIVHDIACPLCRIKYGNTNGSHQEAESAALLEEFLADFQLPQAIYERILFLVTHHHTYTGIDALDYQILLEADYLVNAGESPRYAASIDAFRKNVFRTASGLSLLDSMYPPLPENPDQI